MQTWKIYVVEQTFCLHHLVRNVLQTFIYNSRRILWNIFMKDSLYHLFFQFQGEKTTHNFALSDIFILFWCQSDHRWCPTNTSNLNLATPTWRAGEICYGNWQKLAFLSNLYLLIYLKYIYFFLSISLVKWGLGVWTYFLFIILLELKNDKHSFFITLI